MASSRYFTDATSGDPDLLNRIFPSWDGVGLFGDRQSSRRLFRRHALAEVQLVSLGVGGARRVTFKSTVSHCTEPSGQRDSGVTCTGTSA